jgi:hypothetical protein
MMMMMMTVAVIIVINGTFLNQPPSLSLLSPSSHLQKRNRLEL